MTEINGLDKESDRTIGGEKEQASKPLPGQSLTSQVALPWYQNVRSMVSKEAVYSVVGRIRHYDFEDTLSQEFKKLIQSGKHSSSFVHQTINESLLTMQGTAIIAAFLKQKYQLENLYVCKSLEALQEKLSQIQELPGDSRHALIIGGYYEEDDYKGESSSEYVSDFSHKTVVCVEKTGSMIKLAILDSLGDIKEFIAPRTVFLSPRELKFMEVGNLEAILWYVCRALKPENTAIYYSTVQRQHTGYGCETFALKDAISFLRDPKFFEKIKTREIEFIDKTTPENPPRLRLREIEALPPAFMKGVQSNKVLEAYYQKYLQDRETDKLQLTQHIEKHTVKDDDKSYNYYINHQSFKYHLFVLSAFQSMKEKELQQLIKTIFLRSYRPACNPSSPLTPSDLHRWHNTEFRYS
ncbi:MAG: hypothetical protein ABSA17_05520 [Rhabdochlamydiaceae bacterium]|jgi:hypothetical protein